MQIFLESEDRLRIKTQSYEDRKFVRKLGASFLRKYIEATMTTA